MIINYAVRIREVVEERLKEADLKGTGPGRELASSGVRVSRRRQSSAGPRSPHHTRGNFVSIFFSVCWKRSFSLTTILSHAVHLNAITLSAMVLVKAKLGSIREVSN